MPTAYVTLRMLCYAVCFDLQSSNVSGQK